MENQFDKAATSWDNNPRRVELAKNVLRQIRKHIPINDNMVALDYGTGTGLILLGIQPLVQHITGMDNSEGMLKVLQKTIEDAGITNVTLHKHNIEKEKLPVNQYDLIFANMTLHHIENINAFFTETFRALNNQGTLCIIDLETEDGSFHSPEFQVAHHGFSKDFLKSELSNTGYTVQKTPTFFTINKNQKHYPVFMAIAQKPTAR